MLCRRTGTGAADAGRLGAAAAGVAIAPGIDAAFAVTGGSSPGRPGVAAASASAAGEIVDGVTGPDIVAVPDGSSPRSKPGLTGAVADATPGDADAANVGAGLGFGAGLGNADVVGPARGVAAATCGAAAVAAWRVGIGSGGATRPSRAARAAERLVRVWPAFVCAAACADVGTVPMAAA